MREILFRGKKLNSSNWIYGYLCNDYVTGELFIQHQISEHEYPKWKANLIIENTIGQFTGLLDKNLLQIFEGDIVTNDRKINYLVSFENGSFILRHTVLKDIDGSFYKWGNLSRVYELDNFDIEVIGNIHDGVKHE